MREMLLSFLDDRLAYGSESTHMYIFDPDGGGRHRAIARDTAHLRIRTPFSSLFGADPKSKMDDDLTRAKSFIETGHQPHDAYEKQMRGSTVDWKEESDVSRIEHYPARARNSSEWRSGQNSEDH